MELELEISLHRDAFRLDISQSVRAPVAALFGPPGSGKSTILKAIAGVVSPDRGLIRLNGRRLFDSDREVDVPAELRPVGYVSQGREVVRGDCEVKAHLVEGARAIDSVDAERQVESAVAVLEIEHLLPRRLTSLSDGEQRTVALAKALCSQPALLLFDEPLITFDSKRKLFIPCLRRVVEEMDTSVLYVSHNIPEVQGLANVVITINHGHVECAGPPDAAWSNIATNLRSSYARIRFRPDLFADI